MIKTPHLIASTLCLLLAGAPLQSFAAPAESQPPAASAQTPVVDGKIIAVADFSNNTGDEKLNYLQYGLSSSLITNLAGYPELTLVERSRFEAIVKEMGLGSSGMIDANSAAKLGGALGASQVIVGELVRAGKRLRLNVRLLDVRTVKVLHAASEDGQSQEDIFKLLDHVAAQIAIRMGVDPGSVLHRVANTPNPPTPMPDADATPAPSKESATATEGGISPWVWVGLGAAVILGGAGAVYYFMTHNKPKPPIYDPYHQAPDPNKLPVPQPTFVPNPQPTVQPHVTP